MKGCIQSGPRSRVTLVATGAVGAHLERGKAETNGNSTDESGDDLDLHASGAGHHHSSEAAPGRGAAPEQGVAERVWVDRG